MFVLFFVVITHSSWNVICHCESITKVTKSRSLMSQYSLYSFILRESRIRIGPVHVQSYKFACTVCTCKESCRVKTERLVQLRISISTTTRLTGSGLTLDSQILDWGRVIRICIIAFGKYVFLVCITQVGFSQSQFKVGLAIARSKNKLHRKTECYAKKGLPASKSARDSFFFVFLLPIEIKQSPSTSVFNGLWSVDRSKSREFFYWDLIWNTRKWTM